MIYFLKNLPMFIVRVILCAPLIIIGNTLDLLSEWLSSIAEAVHWLKRQSMALSRSFLVREYERQLAEMEEEKRIRVLKALTKELD